jgi:hypothetical protein
MYWATSWAPFSQAHPVTLPEKPFFIHFVVVIVWATCGLAS